MALMLCGSLASAQTATDALLKQGVQGDAVVELQKRLIELGFLDGKADGDFGKSTQSAVSAFQAFLAGEGYPVAADGVAGEQTIALLYDEDVAARCQAVRSGDRSTLVRKLQKRLIELGYLFGTADLSFGRKTEDALKRFQKMLIDAGEKGIEASGVLDEKTRKLLYSDLSGYKMVTPVFFDEDKPLSLADDNLYSEACILIDADSGKVLYGKNEKKRMYPASTTKIMTLMLALGRGKLNEVVTVPASAGKVPADSSLVPLTVGEQMPFVDLLYGLILRSGNDAANAVATLTSGSVDKFVVAMNKKAQALGMDGTHYVNPHGYHDPDHYTTAADMALLTRKALQNEKFRKIVTAKSYTMAATAKRKALTLNNAYDILKPSSASYYPYAFGVKTGSTSAAGYCYVGAAEKNGKTLICVLLNCGGVKGDKWVDARRLFNYGFAL